MSENDFHEIEKALKIELPTEYRDLMLSRCDELASYGCFNDDWLSCIFLSAQAIVSVNLEERELDTDTVASFPDWWKTLVIIGTNGGGDYYCLRLDGHPGVEMIGSDCGSGGRTSESFRDHVDYWVNRHREEMKAKEEEAKGQARLSELSRFAPKPKS